MKINWCKIFLHKWVYNKIGDQRRCKKCGKEMILDNEFDIAGMGGGTYWKKKP